MPQDNILGPVLWILYIADLVENVTSDSLQYADDSTLHKYSKPKNLKTSVEELESDLEAVSLWSSNNSLVFNDDVTKLMLFTTAQLSEKHNLSNSELFKVMHTGEAIERVNTKKILENHFDENLSWSYLVNYVMQSTYATLRNVCQFNCFTPYKVSKSLAETLIISKYRYCSVVFS